MCKRASRHISVLLVAFLFVALMPPALASTGVEYNQKTSIWHWLAGKGSILHDYIGYVFGPVCPNSEDGYHHANSYQKGLEDGYYSCICSYCGQTFTAYESDLQQSYDAQVAELPAQGVTSAGKLIWHPNFNDVPSSGGFHYNFFNSSSMFDTLPLENERLFSISSDISNNAVKVIHKSDSYYSRYKSGYFYFSVVPPMDGTYGVLPSYRCFSIRAVDSTGSIVEQTGDFTQGSYLHFSKGGKIDTPSVYYNLSVSEPWSGVSYWYFPVYEIVPDSALDITSGDTYNINSRPTSITGDYGIIGDNGQITKVEGDYIVNETTNNYHNPATGTTTPIVDWSYDYGDRTYSLTLEGELSAEVQFGDDNVTINETTVNESGDTVTNNYTIYYLVDGSGSGTEDPDPSPSPSDPPACAHTWTETSRTEPTCTTAGKVMSTCSKCNQTKTEAIPATGHTWVVERTVQTTYDEEGNLLQQGYTIYKCSVCGEEYKDMEGTGPPGEEEKKSIWEKLGDLIGSIFGGIGELIEAVLGKLLDALQSLADMLMGKLKSVIETVLSIFDEVPALFGGFLDFLGAIFPYLPPEITMLLTFGVVAVVFIGILKAVRR